VGFDHGDFVKMLGVGQDTRRGHEPAGEGPLEIHDIKDVVFDLVGVDGNGPLDLFDRPPVNVEHAIQDGTGVENAAQRFAQVPQFVRCLGLEVAELVEGPDAGEAGLDEAGVGGPLARQWQGSHRFHSGSIERSQ
jgi:hypothetical protein